MRLQDKKLNVIEQLIIINDEKVFEKIEEIINSSLQRPRLKKFTKQDLIKRAKLSEKDIENGDVISQEQAEKLAKKW